MKAEDVAMDIVCVMLDNTEYFAQEWSIISMTNRIEIMAQIEQLVKLYAEENHA